MNPLDNPAIETLVNGVSPGEWIGFEVNGVRRLRQRHAAAMPDARLISRGQVMITFFSAELGDILDGLWDDITDPAIRKLIASVNPQMKRQELCDITWAALESLGHTITL